MADLTTTVAPKTDQLNADDFIGKGDRTIKITGVRSMDSRDQPIAISYEGDGGKPWKPCLGMRRVLIELWGPDAAKEASKHYVGRRITLFRDPDIAFGKIVVGGIRISHASDINQEKKIALTVGRARREEFIVKPLRAEKPPAQANVEPMQDDEFAALKKDVFGCLNSDALKAVYNRILDNAPRMTAEQKTTINAEYKATKAAVEKSEA